LLKPKKNKTMNKAVGQIELENLVELNEKEIENFRLRFIKIKQQAESDISFQRSRLQKDERMNEDERISNACLEAGIIDEIDRSIKNANIIIRNCDNAILRIENKTFGICHETGNPIPKSQLDAYPFLTRIAKPLK